jgi:hypothetical protein
MSSWNLKNNLTIDNGKFLNWTDSSGSYKNNVLGLNSNGNVNLLAGPGTGGLYLNPSGSSFMFLGNSGGKTTIVQSTLGVGISTTTGLNSTLALPGNGWVGLNSSSGYLGLSASNNLGNSSGSRVLMYSNGDTSGNAGQVNLYTGNVTSGHLNFYTGNDGLRMQVLANGITQFLPDGVTSRLSISDTSTYVTNDLTVLSTTVSTGTTTGALVVRGGLAVVGNSFIGGTLGASVISTGSLSVVNSISVPQFSSASLTTANLAVVNNQNTTTNIVISNANSGGTAVSKLTFTNDTVGGLNLSFNGSQVATENSLAYLRNDQGPLRLQAKQNVAGYIYMDTAGNVGIGTTSPAYNLDITADLRARGLTVGSVFTTTINGTSPNSFLTSTPSTYSALTVNNLNSTNISTANLIATTRASVSHGSLYCQTTNFYIGNGLASAGNVIQTASGIAGSGSWIEMYDRYINAGSMVLGSPLIKLTDGTGGLYGTIQKNNLTINFDGTNSTGIFVKDFYHGIAYEPVTDALLVQGFASGALKTNSNGNRILSWFDSGYVGIATSAPICQFDVTNSVNADVRLNLQNKNSGSSAFTYLSLNNDNSGLVVYLNSSTRTTGGGANNATFRNDAGSLILQSKGQAATMIINTSGNVGIGTTSPSYLLDVAGSFRSTFCTVSSLLATTDLTASGITLSTISGNSVIKNSGSAGLYLENSTGIGNGGSWIELYPPTNNSGMLILGGSSIAFRDSGNAGYGSIQRNYLIMTSDGVNNPGVFVKDPSHGILTEISTDALLVQGYASGALKTTSNGNRALSWFDSGYIGIGTSSPTCLLDVTNSVNSDVRLNLQNKNSGSNAFAYLSLQNDHSGLVLYLNSSARTTGGGADSATIRNDAGSLILQSKGQATTMTFDTNGSTTLVGSGFLFGTNTQFSYLSVKDTTGNLTGAKYWFDVQGGNILNLNANSYSTTGSSVIKSKFTPNGGANFPG